MQTEALKKVALGALEELKGIDIVEFDVRDKTSVTDIMIIASGSSDRHVRSLADAVVTAAKKSGVLPLGVEGEGEGEWVLVDLGDVVVHVMQPRTREFYALEKLWSVTEQARERETASRKDQDQDQSTPARAFEERKLRWLTGRPAHRNIYAPSGELIVAQGDPLTPEVISRLEEEGMLTAVFFEATLVAAPRRSAGPAHLMRKQGS